MHGLPSVPGERGQERTGLLLCWDAGSDEPLVGVRGLPPPPPSPTASFLLEDAALPPSSWASPGGFCTFCPSALRRAVAMSQNAECGERPGLPL